MEKIAERNGYKSQSIISDFKNNLLSKIAELAKIDNEQLQVADLDFLIKYKEFIENDLFFFITSKYEIFSFSPISYNIDN